MDESFSCLVLASDGLWDTCSAELAVVEVRRRHRGGKAKGERFKRVNP